MKVKIGYQLIIILLVACTSPTQTDQSAKKIPLEGTWKLLSGTTIEKGVSTVTDYTKGKEFIKIINGDHFAFLSHDLDKGKDTATALFSAGGGHYSLTDSSYTENLEYCNDRQWEGNPFKFTITISGDTLIQQGIEKVENIGVNRINIEKYLRVKS